MRRDDVRLPEPSDADDPSAQGDGKVAGANATIVNGTISGNGVGGVVASGTVGEVRS